MPDWIESIPVIGGLMALFGFTLKHAVNSDRHPKKSDVVFKDVCDAERRAITDAFMSMAQRIDDLKESNKDRFDRLEKLINNK